MTFRIVKYKEGFAVQRKSFFWWLYEETLETDLQGFAHSEIIIFPTKEKAREYIRECYQSEKVMAEVVEYIKI